MRLRRLRLSLCGGVLPVGDRDAHLLLNAQSQRTTGRLLPDRHQPHEFNRAPKALGNHATATMSFDGASESRHYGQGTIDGCFRQPKVDLAQLAPIRPVGDSGRMANINTDTHDIKEAMRQRGINQKEMAARLRRLGMTQKGKRPEAAVSNQLRKRRMNPDMAAVYWQAIREGDPAQNPPSTSTDALATAVRLLARCSPAQLERAIGYLTSLLESP